MHDVHDTSAQEVPADGTEPLVRIRGLTKRFGGTLALDGVDLDVHAGSVLALLGPNGAGKSTLIKILAGVHQADVGRITVDGHPLGGHTATHRMSFIHQDLGLVEWMTVAENIALSNGYARRAGLISWRRTRERCTEALRSVAGHLDPDTTVSRLAPAERSLVAVARALAARAKLIVLDEPTARLPAADCARLFRVLHSLRDRGHGILYVSHRLDEVYEVADTFAVLRDGRLVRQGPLAGHAPGSLVRDITGEEPVGHRPAPARADGPPVLQLDGVRTAGAGPVDLDLRAREAVGLVGLSGAGHRDLGRALAGARPLLGGRARLAGRPYRPRTVPEAVALGVAFVPGDRQREGCLTELTVRENLLANPGAAGGAAPRWIRPRRERADAVALIDRFSVRPRDSEAGIATLSGGNQQKAVLARWLLRGCRVLLLDEPTRGVDVGARAELYAVVRRLADEGLAVLLVSSEVPEVLGLADRVLVLREGRVVHTAPARDLDEHRVLDLVMEGSPVASAASPAGAAGSATGAAGPATGEGRPAS
ncbi:sugar ABC transporter ATP-binding protein [Streptomyces ossamyceticus]|uniref:sugar ABC transporter ATP-binding protein n=1 Tax=Streptomyces ossamyceticus TaxID=249581 RepID=UPI00099E9EA5